MFFVFYLLSFLLTIPVLSNAQTNKNLAPNYGFEQSPSRYSGMMIWTNESPHSGEKCIEQKYKIEDYWNCIQLKSPIKCKPGEFYRLSIWNKNTVPAGNITMGIRFINKQNKSISYRWKALVANTGKWSESSMTFETPPNTVFMAIYMRVGGAVKTGRVFWDTVTLKKVSKPIQAIRVAPLKATVFFKNKQGVFSENPISNYNYKFSNVKPEEVKVNVNFIDKTFLPAKLTYTLKQKYSDGILKKRTFNIDISSEKLTIDPKIQLLPLGHYIMDLTLKKNDGSFLNRHTRLISILPEYKFPKLEAIKKASVKGTQLEVNGKPFMAISLYHPALTSEYFKGISSFGENVKQVWAGGENVDRAISRLQTILDLCVKNNSYAYIVLHTEWALDRKTKKFNIPGITKAVKALKNHPALLMWSIDEPDALKIPPAEISRVYKLLKKMDKNHPVIVNLCQPDKFKYYLPYSDIASTDFYPYPNGIGFIHERNLMLMEPANFSKPLLSVLQTYNSLGGNLPSRAWLKAEVYLCLTQGMKLFYYYSFRDRKPAMSLCQSPEMQSYVKEINIELSKLRKVIVAPALENQDVSKLNTQGIHCTYRQVGKEKYLVAVNIINKPTRAVFKLFGTKNAIVNVLFEDGRKIKCVNGILKDNFGPYQVHIYKF